MPRCRREFVEIVQSSSHCTGCCYHGSGTGLSADHRGLQSSCHCTGCCYYPESANRANLPTLRLDEYGYSILWPPNQSGDQIPLGKAVVVLDKLRRCELFPRSHEPWRICPCRPAEYALLRSVVTPSTTTRVLQHHSPLQTRMPAGEPPGNHNHQQPGG